MAGRLTYDENYPVLLAFWIRSDGRKSNVEIAEYFRTTDVTIGRWRKKYPDFDRAIIDPNGIMTDDIFQGLKKLLSTEESEDIKGALHLMVKFGFGQAKGLEAQVKEEIERQLDKTDSKLDEEKGIKIYSQWKDKELTSGEAEAKLQFAGLPVPQEIEMEMMSQSNDKKMAHLDKLGSLKEKGIISEEQFDRFAKELFS